MKQGSGRFGIDFEAKAREFVARYGFDIIAENEVVKCVEQTHQKPSHEIDFITWFISLENETKIPKPPLNGFTGKFMVSCKDGEPLNQGEVDKTKNELECVRKDKRFPDVEGAIIVCASKHPNLKIPENVKVWDSTYMHLLGEKMKIAQMIKISKLSYNENAIKSKGYSVIWQVNSFTDPTTGQQQPSFNVYIFNEDADKSIGKSEVFEFTDTVVREIKEKNNVDIRCFINIYSASGIRTDLTILKGKYLSERPSYNISKIIDLSTATWTTYIDDSFSF